MKKKQKSNKISSDNKDKITQSDFDSVVKSLLEIPPQPKKAEMKDKNSYGTIIASIIDDRGKGKNSYES